MSKKIFVNIPVTDLQKSMDFYTKLGFSNNPTFTDETAACMVLSDDIFVMLLTHDKFKQFTTKKLADTKTHAAVINAIGLESAEEVKKFAEDAVAAGGTEPIEAKDYDFMVQRSIEDLDGNLWEATYMDMSKFPS